MKRLLLIVLPFLLIVGCGKKDGLHTEYYDDEKEKKMDYGLTGMKMERSVGKERLRMGKEMDYGLIGMKMDR